MYTKGNYHLKNEPWNVLHSIFLWRWCERIRQIANDKAVKWYTTEEKTENFIHSKSVLCIFFSTVKCTVRDVPYKTAITFSVFRCLSINDMLSTCSPSFFFAVVMRCYCCFSACTYSYIYIFKHKNKWAIWSKQRKIRNSKCPFLLFNMVFFLLSTTKPPLSTITFTISPHICKRCQPRLLLNK